MSGLVLDALRYGARRLHWGGPLMAQCPEAAMISAELVRAILGSYLLPRDGVHGVAHWARVLENGLRLSAVTGAKVAVVELFAVFHDARRENEHTDPGHGRRGAELAGLFRGWLFDLDDGDFALLEVACSDH